MITTAFLAAATIGPTAFAVLVWGSILLVLAVFVYVVRALVLGTDP